MTPKHLERLGGAARRERRPANRLLAHCRQEACVHGLNPFQERLHQVKTQLHELLRRETLDAAEFYRLIGQEPPRTTERRLCPACRRQERPTADEVDWLKFYSQPVPKQTWHAVGCAQCGLSGYRGRIGIFEVHRLREEDSDLILSHADEHTIRRRLRKFGTLSLLEDDLVKVADGTTSFAEIQSIGGLDYYASRPARRARPTTAVPKAAQPAPSLRPSDPLP